MFRLPTVPLYGSTIRSKSFECTRVFHSDSKAPFFSHVSAFSYMSSACSPSLMSLACVSGLVGTDKEYTWSTGQSA